MTIDHIFIFSDKNGREADELVDFGLLEGSGRLHPGQGTVNRKFYFGFFFLEILWMNNEEEITSTRTQPTRLWERAHFHTSGYSRFGLCLDPTPDTDVLFADAFRYQPLYFPDGMTIDMCTQDEQPALPAAFRLPFRGEKSLPQEPMSHPNGIRSLNHAKFGVASLDSSHPFVQPFAQQADIGFVPATANHLTLTFDGHTTGKIRIFENLNLTILY